MIASTPTQEPVPDSSAARPLAVHVIQPKTVLNRMRPFRRQAGETNAKQVSST